MNSQLEDLTNALEIAVRLKGEELGLLSKYLKEYESAKNEQESSSAKGNIKNSNNKISELKKSIKHLAEEINVLTAQEQERLYDLRMKELNSQLNKSKKPEGLL